MTTQNQQALTPVKKLELELAQRINQLKAVLPANVTPEKFARVTIMAISNNKDLMNCNRETLFNEVLKCASDGLVPDGRDAAIVSFRDSAKYMPMVGGICKRVRNSGLIKMMDSFIVHENDEFKCWTDEKGPHFNFQQVYKNRGEILLTFAYAIDKDENVYIEIVDQDQMRDIRNASQGKNTPWNGPFYTEMMRKSAIRRLAKYRLPTSSDIDDLVRRDDDFYDLPEKKSDDQIKQEVKQAQEAKKIELDEKDSLIEQIEKHAEAVNAGKSLNEKAMWMVNNLKVTSYKELKKQTVSDLTTLLDTIKNVNVVAEVKVNKTVKDLSEELDNTADMFVENMMKQGAVNV